jgi:hypothetical protein
MCFVNIYGFGFFLLHLKKQKKLTYFSIVNVYECFAFILHKCRNPNFGLTTKAGACKSVGRKGSLGITSHVSESVGECEGMNPHTPK